MKLKSKIEINCIKTWCELLLLQELEDLKRKCAVELAAAEDDHLLVKLTDYHSRLSSAVDNFSTERLSPEVQTSQK